MRGKKALKRPSEESLKKIKLDFFLMHMVTSSLSVRTLIPHLDINNSIKLMQAHLAVGIMYYIARGIPVINRQALEEYEPSRPITSWNEIIRLATSSFELHVPKVVRSLLLACELFAKPDQKRGGSQERESKFFKTAALTVDQMVHLGNDWDFSAIGYAEAWKEDEKKDSE